MTACLPTHSWELAVEFGLGELQKALPGRLRLDRSRTIREPWRLVDDFDWALWANGHVLLVSAERARLASRDGDLLRAALARPPGLPLSAGVLPEGPLRSTVLRYTARPLLLRLECICHRQEVRLRDSLGKMIAQGWVERWKLPGSTMPLMELCLSPLRGYREEFAPVRSLLDAHAIRCPPASPLLAALAKGAVGAFLPELPDVGAELRDQASPIASVRDCLARLLANSWHNEKGVVDDLDPECLHHYRVNLRRARVLAAETREILGPEAAARLGRDLAAIADRTGSLRDLDVQLANRQWYESLLPEEQVCHLAPFMDSLARQRQQQCRSLQRYLRSRTHGHRRERLGQLLGDHPDRGTFPSLPELLGRRIQHRFARLAHHGRSTGDEPSDGQLHRLRIQIKKLRYVSASSRALLSKARMKDWLGRLSHLQDAFGDAHDLAVCRQWVTEYGTALGGMPDPGEAGAIHALAEALSQGLVARRADAAQQLHRFLSDCRERDLPARLGKEEGA